MTRTPHGVNLRRIAALSSIALAFVAGGIAARIAVRQPPARFAADFAQPLVVVTAWHEYGGACFAMLAATIAIATACTIAIAFRLPAPDRPGVAVAITATAAVVAAWSWPFVFSSDVYAYAAYGAMSVAGLDPYRLVPAYVHGNFVDAARWQWSGTYPVCIYGPAFVAFVADVVRWFASSGVGATLWVLRFSAGAAFIGSILALDVIVAGAERRRRFMALCAYALNPVAIWSVAEGHNDAFVLLALFGGAALIRRSNPALGAALAGLSPLVKATGVPLAAGLAVDAALFASAAHGRRVALGMAAGLCAAAFFALPPLLPALAAVRATGRYAPAASLQGLIGTAPVAACALAFAIYGGFRLRQRQRDGFAWLGIATWTALPNGYPWYALWMLPAVLAAEGGVAAAALWSATILSVIRYLPDAAGGTGADALAAVLPVLPLLLVPLVFRRNAPSPKKATSP